MLTKVRFYPRNALNDEYKILFDKFMRNQGFFIIEF